MTRSVQVPHGVDRTRVLVLGGAACVWDDAQRARELGTFDKVIAVNDIGGQWPGRIDLWATLHPEKLGVWAAQRKANGFNTDYEVWTSRTHAARHATTLALIDKDIEDIKGSSGLLAPHVAITGKKWGRIVLAGVPMQADQPHFFDDTAWTQARQFTIAWIRNKPYLQHHVRSMSGWTHELLGAPTVEWLA